MEGDLSGTKGKFVGRGLFGGVCRRGPVIRELLCSRRCTWTYTEGGRGDGRTQAQAQAGSWRRSNLGGQGWRAAAVRSAVASGLRFRFAGRGYGGRERGGGDDKILPWPSQRQQGREEKRVSRGVGSLNVVLRERDEKIRRFRCPRVAHSRSSVIRWREALSVLLTAPGLLLLLPGGWGERTLGEIWRAPHWVLAAGLESGHASPSGPGPLVREIWSPPLLTYK